MKLRNAILSAAVATALGVSGAANASATWRINYADSETALGYGPGGPAASNLTDEYRYIAESLVMFNDNGDGVISGGDTYVDVVVFTIDQLNLGGVSNVDIPYLSQDFQITGTLTATGTQIDALNYTVDTANISFYMDSPNFAPGTAADFGLLSTFNDGVLVQTGTGSGGGVNGANVPDGAINIDFALTDILSSLVPDGAPFEIFDPFADLDNITFETDSNNQQCGPGGADCFSSVAGLEAFFSVDTQDFDFFFHTRSDGSAVKQLQVPEPASVALLSLGLLAAGAAQGRRRNRKA